MLEFDFNLEQLENDLQNFKIENFDPEIKYIELDICGLVKKLKEKKRTLFNLKNEIMQLEYLLKAPPSKNEVFKMLSIGGGFSSLAIIKYIAEKESIEELYASTFRIGKKHFQELCNLFNSKKLNKVFLITSDTQKRVDEKMEYKGKTYNYFEYITKICEENNWKLQIFNNHSKLLLMRTPKNFYVVETSSNLNENPKIEHFSFENDKELFAFYKNFFEELQNINE